MHRWDAICTEIKLSKSGNVVAYSFQRKSNLSEERAEQKPVGRIGNETPLRETENDRQTESSHNTKDWKTKGSAGSARTD